MPATAPERRNGPRARRDEDRHGDRDRHGHRDRDRHGDRAAVAPTTSASAPPRQLVAAPTSTHRRQRPRSPAPTFGHHPRPRPRPPPPLPPPPRPPTSSAPTATPARRSPTSTPPACRPAGCLTTTRTTDLVISTPGAVVQDVQLDGADVIVNAPNVTLRRLKLRGGYIDNRAGSTCNNGLVIEDTTLEPAPGQNADRSRPTGGSPPVATPLAASSCATSPTASASAATAAGAATVTIEDTLRQRASTGRLRRLARRRGPGVRRPARQRPQRHDRHGRHGLRRHRAVLLPLRTGQHLGHHRPAPDRRAERQLLVPARHRRAPCATCGSRTGPGPTVPSTCSAPRSPRGRPRSSARSAGPTAGTSSRRPCATRRATPRAAPSRPSAVRGAPG